MIVLNLKLLFIPYGISQEHFYTASLLVSLSSQRLNNTRNAQLDVIFFNRAAKVGSEALMELLLSIAQKNKLNILTQGPLKVLTRTRTLKQQMKQALWVSRLSPGTVYIEHCNWLNFTNFKLPLPIYVNLVRDPVERVISWYYYVRGAYRNAIFYHLFPHKPMQPEAWYKKSYNQCVRSGDEECQYVPESIQDTVANYKRQTLFFCGDGWECLPFDSPSAVQQAKRNVERDYAVVGSWEDTNITLAVLEAYIPRFFRHVQNLPQLRTLYLNNTRYSNNSIAVFNRPTRALTEPLLHLLRELSAINDMNIVVNGPVRSMNRTRTIHQQAIEMKWITDLEEGTLYMTHGNWLNFKDVERLPPVWISFVRDPVDRVIDNYYRKRRIEKRAINRRFFPGLSQNPKALSTQSFNDCVRSANPECQYIPNAMDDVVKDFRRQSLFFCGHDNDCLPFNSAYAIQIAKRNVEKEYAVVGTWEEIYITLTVLENAQPTDQ
ncbi:heparan sulfate 2-O-sulfotransferase pipe-like [Scaptodrosophila lebanonensis]|uniref:Heparan sulfate 2-O-sulfotransferase pipe-like n=1 Tax=Drosophila lebanonensis TaxID=7225 RepID=A0A6J2UL90_DROLE|nr:heparan sulfate 2-O-sulfotransferase pipe-like [Scaptodrosophila lebanonensis]